MDTNKHDHHDFQEVPGPRGPHGPHGRRRGGRPPEGFEGFGRRSRRRDDARVAALLLLAEGPMHGCQLMQTVAERTDGTRSPGPGAVYPTLNQLEDEGLVRIGTSGDRKEVSFTEVGRAHAEEHRPEWPNLLTNGNGPCLRELMYSLSEAVRQVGCANTNAQRQQTARKLTDVWRRVYLILAGDEEQVDSF